MVETTGNWLYTPGLFEQVSLDELKAQIEWEHHSIKIFGKLIPEPRLSAWYGDPECAYTYSGKQRLPKPWTKLLLELKQRSEQICNHPFNSALLNLYRDGQDSMGWHSDDEKELGTEPCIASLSFGASRRFCFRRKDNKKLKQDLILEHGSLLLMQGATQQEWQHALPKQARVTEERINITFRLIKG